MKKNLLAFTLLVCMVFATFAQDKKAEQPKTGPANKSASAAKPATAAKPAAAPTAIRKDGKPDMRYKANKEAAKHEGPKKKDGTPDKRFKENKEGERKKG